MGIFPAFIRENIQPDGFGVFNPTDFRFSIRGILNLHPDTAERNGFPGYIPFTKPRGRPGT